MTELAVELDDEAAELFRRRAQREGVDPTQLVARLLSAAATEPGPYDLVGSFESDVVGARDVRPRHVTAFTLLLADPS